MQDVKITRRWREQDENQTGSQCTVIIAILPLYIMLPIVKVFGLANSSSLATREFLKLGKEK
jgi:hypothetical protein